MFVCLLAGEVILYLKTSECMKGNSLCTYSV